MHKLFTIFVVLLLVATVTLGCGKKETSPEAEMTMPITEGAPGTTNLITKAGAPVEAGSAQVPIMEESTMPPYASAYIPPMPQEIQQALTNAGLYTGAIDGKIGPMTKKAITEFQQQNGLTADGKVGKKTWDKLKVYLNQNPQ